MAIARGLSIAAPAKMQKPIKKTITVRSVNSGQANALLAYQSKPQRRLTGKQEGIEMIAKGLIDILEGVQLQECCIDHRRYWTETSGGLTASNHAPSCPKYKTEVFLRITVSGEKSPACICEHGELGIWTDEEGVYEWTEIKMTRDQFERLPEFEGY